MKTKEQIIEEMIQQMRVFVERVEKGEVRSKKTYATFKGLLEEWNSLHQKEQEGKAQHVFRRDGCIFHYCPHPELCKDECQSPRGTKHITLREANEIIEKDHPNVPYTYKEQDSQQEGMSAEGFADLVYQKIESALNSVTMLHVYEDEHNHLSLVDFLSNDSATIKEGKEEIENIINAISYELDPILKQYAASRIAEGEKQPMSAEGVMPSKAEIVVIGEYYNAIIKEKGHMSYPEISAAAEVWIETNKRFVKEKQPMSVEWSENAKDRERLAMQFLDNSNLQLVHENKEFLAELLIEFMEYAKTNKTK